MTRRRVLSVLSQPMTARAIAALALRRTVTPGEVLACRRVLRALCRRGAVVDTGRRYVVAGQPMGGAGMYEIQFGTEGSVRSSV